MKKVLMSVALVSAIPIAAGYCMFGSDKNEMNLSDLVQANVEALADGINEADGCKPISEYVCRLGSMIFGDKAPIYAPIE